MDAITQVHLFSSLSIAPTHLKLWAQHYLANVLKALRSRQPMSAFLLYLILFSLQELKQGSSFEEHDVVVYLEFHPLDYFVATRTSSCSTTSRGQSPSFIKSFARLTIGRSSGIRPRRRQRKLPRSPTRAFQRLLTSIECFTLRVDCLNEQSRGYLKTSTSDIII